MINLLKRKTISQNSRTLQAVSSFFLFRLLIPRFRGKLRYQGRRDWMGMEPALYQLMGIRMNSVMNGITNRDGEYQAIIRKSDEYSAKLDKMDLSKEARLLIDSYVSEQNALGSRYGMLAYLLGYSDCKEMLLEKCLFAEPQQAS